MNMLHFIIKTKLMKSFFNLLYLILISTATYSQTILKEFATKSEYYVLQEENDQYNLNKYQLPDSSKAIILNNIEVEGEFIHSNLSKSSLTIISEGFESYDFKVFLDQGNIWKKSSSFSINRLGASDSNVKFLFISDWVFMIYYESSAESPWIYVINKEGGVDQYKKVITIMSDEQKFLQREEMNRKLDSVRLIRKNNPNEK